jgi:hypothetical protein
MPRYAASATKTTGAAAAWVFQLRQTSAARSIRVLEVGLFSTTAAAGTYTLERSNSIGATFTTTVAGTPEDPLSSAAGGTLDTAITTAPTRLATPLPFRQVSFPATAGSGMVWTFGPDGLVIPASGGMLIWQTSSAAVGLACYWVFDER